MIFETTRLYIRHWGANDLHDLHDLYSDPAICEFIGPSLNISETKQIFEDQLMQYKISPGVGRYVIIKKKTGLFIGTFLLRSIDEKNAVEIGYAFKKADWGKGLATEVVTRSLKYIFESTPFQTIYAFTEPANVNSKNVLDKCGFVQQDDIFEEGAQLNSFSITQTRLLRWGPANEFLQPPC